MEQAQAVPLVSQTLNLRNNEKNYYDNFEHSCGVGNNYKQLCTDF